MNKSPQLDPKQKSVVRRLIVFFAVLYLIDGLLQSGLTNQPLTFYLKEAFGWGPEQVTAYLTVLTLPWVIKPVYGLISDFVPLFGYRRKSWLTLLGLGAAASWVWLAFASDPAHIITALLVANTCVSASTALCGALMVENGKKHSMSGTFVNQQWSWFFAATVIGSIGGGWLAGGGLHGLHIGALIMAVATFAAVFFTWFLIDEEKAEMNLAGLKASFGSLLSAFKSRVLWVVGLFIFFYHFSPSFGTPLYYYQVDTLHFSQEFIGYLSAIGAAASVAGGVVYAWLQKRVTMKWMMYLCIFLGIISQGSYLMLTGEVSAIVLAVVNGVMGMVTVVACLTLAADYCPDGAEGFSYALLLSITNFAQQASANLGSYMYEQTFHSQLAPLIWVSCAFTAFAFVLVPMLRLGNRMPGEKAAPAQPATPKNGDSVDDSSKEVNPSQDVQPEGNDLKPNSDTTNEGKPDEDNGKDDKPAG